LKGCIGLLSARAHVQNHGISAQRPATSAEWPCPLLTDTEDELVDVVRSVGSRWFGDAGHDVLVLFLILLDVEWSCTVVTVPCLDLKFEGYS
jgi:hypothetical protein